MSKKRKRTAEYTSDSSSTSHPPHRPAQPQSTMGTVHCQPTRDPRVFAACMLAQCPHCTVCMDCEATRDLTWQSDSNLRAQLSTHNATLRAKAAALDRITASFHTTQLFQLQGQLSALQQQVQLLQYRLPTPQQQIDREVVEGVTKFESEIDVEEYHTSPSAGDSLDDETNLKREAPEDADDDESQRPHGVVLISEAEQREARRAIRRLQRRGQPPRDSTLRIPRASIEVAQSNERRSGGGGSIWTKDEDKKLLKGFRDGLSSSAVHDEYLPNRTTDAIRKRKIRLQEGLMQRR